MYSRAIIVGRLTADPELKQTTSGKPVCSFNVACDRAFKDSNGERVPDFHRVVAWQHTAEFVSKYFGKGDPIGIEGSIQNREYTDKDGNTRKVTEIVADRVFFTGASKTRTDSSARDEFEDIGDEDLPF